MITEYQVLASGIDTNVVSMDISWKNESFFQYLAGQKSQAKEENEDQVVSFHGSEQVAVLKPFGEKATSGS